MPGPQAPPRIPLSELKSAKNPPKAEVTHVSTPTVALTHTLTNSLKGLSNNRKLNQRNLQGRPLFYKTESLTIIPIKYLSSLAEINALNLPELYKGFLRDGKKVIGSEVLVPPNYTGSLVGGIPLRTGNGTAAAGGAAGSAGGSTSSKGGKRKHKQRKTRRRSATRKIRR
jgi:hypothetical protein